MQLFRAEEDGSTSVISVEEDTAWDITSANRNVTSFRDLAYVADVTERSIASVVSELTESAREVDPDAFRNRIRKPVEPDEVWAAGVTYEISEKAREAESSKPDIYLDVYDSDRPEVFFKATPNRLVGPNEDVGIRADSEWDVPEPELGVVIYDEEIVGYTIGNDMSSRSIEGQNPLYLPQAKVYDRCCSIGPAIVPADRIAPHELTMTMRIESDGDLQYEDTTTTSKMVRTCEDLVSCYTESNAVPDCAVLLTGTALVPDEGFTLEPGDRISIEIDGIGELVNHVRTV